MFRSIGFALLSALLLLSSVVLLADDHHVDFDKAMNFSKFKTFSVGNGRINSGRPELNNSLVSKGIADAIRAELTARGLTEKTTKADIVVEFTATGLDYTVGPGGRASVIGASRGDANGRGRGRGRAELDEPVDFSEGTMVVDISTTEPHSLVWRGVYHDKEKNSPKLAKKFPDDAKKLFEKYPVKKK
jgi:hypothetical protein